MAKVLLLLFVIVNMNVIFQLNALYEEHFANFSLYTNKSTLRNV